MVNYCYFRHQVHGVARPNPGRERSTGEKSSSLAVIAGVTTPILVILIVVTLLVYLRCYSK